MSFGQPYALVLTAFVPAVAAAWVAVRRLRVRRAVAYTNLDVLACVAPGRRSWRRGVPLALLLLAVLALSLGVARPSVARTVAVERATVILVVDESGSMAAHDVAPTRLAAAQNALTQFVAHVPSRMRVGLVVFSTEPTVSAVPTRNRALVGRAIDLITPGGATSIGDALATAVGLGRRALGMPGRPQLADAVSPGSAPGHGLVSILLLSDGAQTSGRLRPFQGAELARRAGFRVYTVALGTPTGVLGGNAGEAFAAVRVPPDPRTLRGIARLTGGAFVAVTNARRLNDVYARLGSSLGRRSSRADVTFACLLAGIACVLGAGVASALWAPTLP